jgi:hypothetical protein
MADRVLIDTGDKGCACVGRAGGRRGAKDVEGGKHHMLGLLPRGLSSADKNALWALPAVLSSPPISSSHNTHLHSSADHLNSIYHNTHIAGCVHPAFSCPVHGVAATRVSLFPFTIWV